MISTSNVSLVLLAFALVALSACATASTATTPSDLGKPASFQTFSERASESGPVTLTRVRVADWHVDREGLINLDHPKAKKAGLQEGLEPVQIYMYVLKHPKHGTFLVDSGIARTFRTPDDLPVSSLIAGEMNFDKLTIHHDTAQWVEEHGVPQGVFLTHLHLDHIMGMPDIPSSVPVYTGPGEAASSSFLNMFVQGSTDSLLQGTKTLHEWRFPQTSSDALAVVDIFQDGTVFALHTPGHTPGSTAFLVRTPKGPQLIVGDACHTAWGWDHTVEPGTFSANIDQSAKSLRALRKLADSIPNITVHLGHQEHTHTAAH